MADSRRFIIWRIITILTTIVILCQPGPGFSQEGSDSACYECHKKMFTAATYKPYIHRPFMKKECLICHKPLENGKDAATAGVVFPSDLRWLGKSGADVGTHLFAVPAADMNDTLFVEALDKDEVISRFKFFVPYLSSLHEKIPASAAPVISNVKVLEIKRELFISTTIGWQTDTYSSSMVRYGTRGLDYSSDTSSSLTMNHRITLTALKAKTNYIFAVVSRDLAGNEQQSEQFGFSTTDLVPATASSNDADVAAATLEVKEEFSRHGDDTYIIRLTVNQPVSLNIGSLPGPRNSTGTGLPILHSPVIDQVAAATERCSRCHGKYKDVSSHPVNVRPGPNRIIPPEYPTLRNGMITCMSCHDEHASINEFRLIKATKQELCLGCHEEFMVRR